MTNLVKSTCLLLLAGAAFGQNKPGTAQAAQPLRTRPASAYLVTGQPYSAEQTNDHFQTLIDGTHLTQHVATTKIYRDSQGRLRIESAAGLVPPLFRTTEIFDPAPEFNTIWT